MGGPGGSPVLLCMVHSRGGQAHRAQNKSTEKVPHRPCPLPEAALLVLGWLVCSAGQLSLPQGSWAVGGQLQLGLPGDTPPKCGPGPCWCLPALQATAPPRPDRLVAGPLAGWLGRLVNILRNDLAKGGPELVPQGGCRSWLLCFFFFPFSNCQRYFSGRPAAPSPDI